MSKIGIIAASGNLVSELIKNIDKSNEIFIVAIDNEADPEVIVGIDHVWIKPGEVGKAIKAMKKAGVSKVVFAGSIKKPNLYNLKVDLTGAKLLTRIVKDKFLGDNKILSTVVSFIEEHGFEVVGAHEINKNLTIPVGFVSKLKPNKQDNIDIELGTQVVRKLGDLDIGQAAIIECGVVLGVEAIEGTDSLISRCAALKRNNKSSGVLVKLPKPNQELRMDMPTIGLKTIENVFKAGFKGIIIEANKTIFLDQGEVIDFANRNNMFIGAI